MFDKKTYELFGQLAKLQQKKYEMLENEVKCIISNKVKDEIRISSGHVPRCLHRNLDRGTI